MPEPLDVPPLPLPLVPVPPLVPVLPLPGELPAVVVPALPLVLEVVVAPPHDSIPKATRRISTIIAKPRAQSV